MGDKRRGEMRTRYYKDKMIHLTWQTLQEEEYIEMENLESVFQQLLAVMFGSTN